VIHRITITSLSQPHVHAYSRLPGAHAKVHLYKRGLRNTTNLSIENITCTHHHVSIPCACFIAQLAYTTHPFLSLITSRISIDTLLLTSYRSSHATPPSHPERPPFPRFPSTALAAPGGLAAWPGGRRPSCARRSRLKIACPCLAYRCALWRWEFLCGSGRFASGLEPIILARRGVVLKVRRAGWRRRREGVRWRREDMMG
jgi:hypothetical protein